MGNPEFDPANSRVTNGYVHENDSWLYKVVGSNMYAHGILSGFRGGANWIRAHIPVLSEIDALTKFAARNHTLISWVVGNLSYQTARTLKYHRQWVWWIEHYGLPNAWKAGKGYILYWVGESEKFTTRSVKTAEQYLRQYAYSLYITNVKAIDSWAKYLMQRFAQQQNQIDAIIPRITQQVTSGYKPTKAEATDVLDKVITVIVSHDALLRDIAKALAKAALDVLEVDNPIARTALIVILVEVIKKLGIETEIGKFVNTVIGALTGEYYSKSIHDVFSSISERLAALEGNWTAFFDNGGQAVEDFGNTIKPATILAELGLITAYTGFAIADPKDTADVTASVLNEILKPINDAVRGVLDI